MEKNLLCKKCCFKGRKKEFMKDDEYGCGMVHWTAGMATHGCDILYNRAMKRK